MSQHEEKYLTSNDTALRLTNSIVRFDGEFVYVYVQTSIQKDLNLVSIKFLKDGVIKEGLSPNDPKFDVSSVQLGWSKFGNGACDAVFITRPTWRKQKQGVSAENTHILLPDTKSQSLELLYIYNFSTESLLTTNFYNMLTNKKLTTFKEAFKTVSTRTGEDSYFGYYARALNRDFAVFKYTRGPDENVYLFKRNRAIGICNEKGVKLLPVYLNTINLIKLEQAEVPVTYA